MPSKNDVASKLIQWHFDLDRDTREIYRILSRNEDRPGEPIKLLEVNDATIETGRVDAFGFGPSTEVPYPSVIAEVSPAEMERIKTGELGLPAGWDLRSAQRHVSHHARATH